MRDSFKHAFGGIAVAFRDHPNFRIHILTAFIVVVLSFVLSIEKIEFLIVVFTITLVLVVEMINTSIEEITNLITIKWAKQAKLAKDVAAGMVLVTSIGAIIIGIMIFGPYLIEFIT